MIKCRITAVRRTEYADLSEKYENPIPNACDVRMGSEFITDGVHKPEGLCDSAWETMLPFIRELCAGGGNFYGNWMKNEKSAMVSCNDGFRPVSFYIEVTDGEK